MKSTLYSPLRYPGGKASLFNFLTRTLGENDITYGVYVEPFAGGAGAALKLLMLEYVGDIHLNEKDRLIYMFWKSVIFHTDELCEKILKTKVNISQWKYRHNILVNENLQKGLSDIELGFTAFYLNRCNRSGILDAGPIGGNNQSGNWKIDARYNKNELIKRIQNIAIYKDRITLYNKNAIAFLKDFKRKGFNKNEVLLYLDPPYVNHGHELYRYSFKENDHKNLAYFLQRNIKYKWIVSYDDNELIHKVYKQVTKNIFEFNYFANKTKIGRELVIGSKNCSLPEKYEHYSKTKQIISEDTALIERLAK